MSYIETEDQAIEWLDQVYQDLRIFHSYAVEKDKHSHILANLECAIADIEGVQGNWELPEEDKE